MITYRELSRPLRLAVAAPWCLLLGFACAAATPAFRQLLLDPETAQPAVTVSLAGPCWTGTLDPARLPADPVEGKDIAPASVQAAGAVQTSYCFITNSGDFVAGDFGIYVSGVQIADANGCLYAANFVAAPTLYVETVQFTDGSHLSSDGNRLLWTDPFGVLHSIAFAP